MKRLEDIILFSGNHPIEFVNFVINLDTPIDKTDIARLEDKEEIRKSLFPFMEQLDQIKFISSENSFLNKNVGKNMVSYESDGNPSWIALFNEENIFLSIRKYTSWSEIWPQAERRMMFLLSCVNEYKEIKSIEYSVADTFSSAKDSDSLLIKNIFGEKIDKIPENLRNYNDSRWDFSFGYFDNSEHLVKFNAIGYNNGNNNVVKIINTLSKKIKYGNLLKEITKSNIIQDVFSEFHDKNKSIIRSYLNKEILNRMGL